MKSVFYRLIRLLFFVTAGNLVQIYAVWKGHVIWKIAFGILAGICYIVFQFLRPRTMAEQKKLARLAHGCGLIRTGIAWFMLEIVSVILFAVCSSCVLAAQLCGVGTFLVLCGLTFWNGLLHVAFSSKQVKPVWHIVLFFFWWMPIVNLLLTIHIYRVAGRELHFECAKAQLNAVRKESEICKTRYPILLVHGIFFRDWQFFNYWGRIPGELIRNGATIFYGHQQSAQSIRDSARELAVQIRAVCEATGAEKVNIIAHSKGGLDCRCAIQDFGAAPYVATLTTINTPHHGCAFVDELLRKVPDTVAQWLAHRYNRIFKKLGDNAPDFLCGVQELTEERCRVFHQEHPCVPGIAYLAVMSKMKSARSAPFPLWLGYWMNRKNPSGNDGLVTVDSARMDGVPFVLLPETKKRGISHGDMIDLMRENIPDFDVREWYSQYVQQLKKNGY